MTDFLAEIAERAQARIAELQPELDAALKILAAATGAEAPVDERDARLRELSTQVSLIQGDLEAVVQERDELKSLVQRQQSEHADAIMEKQSVIEGITAREAKTTGELQARIEALEAETDVLREGFGRRAPDDEPPEPPEPDAAPIPELESGDSGEGTPEQESVSAPEAEPEPVSQRRGPHPAVTLAEVRDAIREHFGTERFNLRMLSDKMGVGPSTLGRHVRELAANGTLERSGGLAGPNVRYAFVKPSSTGQPTTRPRGELHVVATEAPKDRGETIGGTGRPHGAAPTPGALKKQQQKAAAGGARVKPKRVGGVRV